VVGHGLKRPKVVIYQRIKEGVGQVISSRLAVTPAWIADSLLYGIECRLVGFLKGDDVVLADDEADLVHSDSMGLDLSAERFEDAEEMFLSCLKSGSLGRVHNVLEQKRMETEMKSQPFDRSGVLKSLDNHPGARRRLEKRVAFVNRPEFPLVAMGRTIIEHPNGGGRDLLLADEDDASWREASLL
jgi:hypothetical protein